MKLIIFVYLLFNIVYSSFININTAISISITPNFKNSYHGELINSNDWLKILEYSSNKKVIIDIFDSYHYDFIYNQQNFEKLVQELRSNKVNSIEFSFSFCLNSKNSYKDIIETFNQNLKKNNLYPENIWYNMESNYDNCYNNQNNNNNINNNNLNGGLLNHNFEINQEYYEFTKSVLGTFKEYGFNIGIKVSRDTYIKVFGNKKDQHFSTLPLFYLNNDKNQKFEDYYLSPIGSWDDFKVKQFKKLNGIVNISSSDAEIYLNSHKLLGGIDVDYNYFNGFGSGSGSGGSSSGSSGSSGTSGTSGAQLSGTGEALFI